jgi:hypothetical protein
VNSDAEQELEDARERYFWSRLTRALWALLIVLTLVGGLWTLTVLLAWERYFLLSFLGLLAGLSIAVALGGSSRDRALAGLVVGGVTLPLLAAYLGSTAAESPEAFSANTASLFPFLVHGAVALVGALWISNLWRKRPTRPPPEAAVAPDLIHSEGPPT